MEKRKVYQDKKGTEKEKGEMIKVEKKYAETHIAGIQLHLHEMGVHCTE